MGNTLRVALAVAAVAVSGLAVAAPASASTTSTSICRYSVGVSKDIPVRTGPGKRFRAIGFIPGDREAPIFGTCVTPGRGPSHWIRVDQGEFRGAFVWRNYFDRM